MDKEQVEYLNELLIVPYGIETINMKVNIGKNTLLLIVPYGIETMLVLQIRRAYILLIVPYGIETY